MLYRLYTSGFQIHFCVCVCLLLLLITDLHWARKCWRNASKYLWSYISEYVCMYVYQEHLTFVSALYIHCTLILDLKLCTAQCVFACFNWRLNVLFLDVAATHPSIWGYWGILHWYCFGYEIQHSVHHKSSSFSFYCYFQVYISNFWLIIIMSACMTILAHNRKLHR